jgi:hypothetical protein
VRQIAVLSVALVLTLGWSYATWTNEGEKVTDDVTPLYDAASTDVSKLAWDGKDLKVTVERRKDDRGDYLWVDSTETKVKPPKPVPGHPNAKQGEDEGETSPEEPKPAAEEPKPEEPAAPPEVKVSKFMASQAQGEKLWEAFAPLKALRELDTTGADLKTFGLGPDDKPATLTITKGGSDLVLRVGGETYGNKDRYVEYDHKVYLVDDTSLRPLQYAASQLVERSLYPFADADVDQVDVMTPSGTSISYVHVNKDDKTKEFWARSDSKDKEDQTASTWLDKVFKLKLKDYVDESTVTSPLEPVFTYVVHGKGQEWKVEIDKAAGADGATAWYARSQYNRSLVTLTDSVARNVVDDLDDLTSGQ